MLWKEHLRDDADRHPDQIKSLLRLIIFKVRTCFAKSTCTMMLTAIQILIHGSLLHRPFYVSTSFVIHVLRSLSHAVRFVSQYTIQQ